MTRIVLLAALACSACMSPAVMRHDIDETNDRVARLEQELARLTAYIQQLHAALQAAGAFQSTQTAPGAPR